MKNRIHKTITATLTPSGSVSPRQLLAALGIPENALPPPPPSPAEAFRLALARNDFDAAARIAPEHREKIAELASKFAKIEAAKKSRLDEDLAAENLRHAAAVAALDAQLAAREAQLRAELAEIRRTQAAELAAAERRLHEAESLSAVHLGIPPDLVRAGAEAAHRARAEQRRRAELAAANERDRGMKFPARPAFVRDFND